MLGLASTIVPTVGRSRRGGPNARRPFGIMAGALQHRRGPPVRRWRRWVDDRGVVRGTAQTVDGLEDGTSNYYPLGTLARADQEGYKVEKTKCTEVTRGCQDSAGNSNFARAHT